MTFLDIPRYIWRDGVRVLQYRTWEWSHDQPKQKVYSEWVDVPTEDGGEG